MPPYSETYICVGIPKTALCFAHPDCGTLTLYIPSGVLYLWFALNSNVCICMMAYLVVWYAEKHTFKQHYDECRSSTVYVQHNSNMNERNVWLWCDRAMWRYFSGSHKLTGDRLAIAFAYIAWCLSFSISPAHHLALFWDFPTRHKHGTYVFIEKDAHCFDAVREISYYWHNRFVL